MHKQQGWPQAWEYSQAKLIQTIVRASQEWTEAGVSASRVTTLRRLEEKATKPLLNRDNVRSILPGLWRKRTGLLLSGPKSSFQMISKFCIHLEIKVPRVWRKSGEAQNPCWWKSSVKFSTVSDDLGCHSSAGVGSTVFSEVHSQRSHLPGNFRALHASFFLHAYFWNTHWLLSYKVSCYSISKHCKQANPFDQLYQYWSICEFGITSPDLIANRDMHDMTFLNIKENDLQVGIRVIVHSEGLQKQQNNPKCH